MDKTVSRSRYSDTMLDRALNGLRMSPIPADVRKLFYKVKKSSGNRYYTYLLRTE